jgi:hypothetical protein
MKVPAGHADESESHGGAVTPVGFRRLVHVTTCSSPEHEPEADVASPNVRDPEADRKVLYWRRRRTAARLSGVARKCVSET